MTTPANNSRFAIQIPAIQDEMRVVAMDYQGALSTPFLCDLEVACLRRDLPLVDLLGKSAVLTLFDGHYPRHIHGDMVALEQGAVGKRFSSYRICLRPAIWLLKYRHGMRIFQDQTTRDIVTSVLTEAGIADGDVRWQLSGDTATREYCVQYRESDLDFVTRLLTEEGWFYYFEHSLSGHTLVIADSNSVFANISGPASIPYRPRSGMVQAEDCIYEFLAAGTLQSGGVALRDYGFEKPAARRQASVTAGSFPELQHYHYPGLFTDNNQGQSYSEARLQAHQVRSAEVEAVSDCMRLSDGLRFSLRDHGNHGFNDEYIITGVQLEGRQPQVLEEGASTAGSTFVCRLHAIPAKVQYRPEAKLPRPLVSGVQTAYVTGPQGEEIYTDRYGRIKVQFHWDREGKRDENSSCWLRVSQAWAGNQWGSQMLPRVGQEVIVSFLNGNPDHPVVTGALYNAITQAPYALPANKTRTTFKSQSSPGGDGYNELRLEDKKGSEQVFIHGQKDVDLHVNSQRRDSIEHDRHRIVMGTVMESVAGDLNHSVAKGHNIKVGQTLSHQVGGNLQQKCGQNWLGKVGVNCSLKADTSVVLDAGMSLTLKAAGATIDLGAAGVAITGSQVRINSGGGAGSARNAAPQSPGKASGVEPSTPGVAVDQLVASARFKQQPIAFDKRKAEVVQQPKLQLPQKRTGGVASAKVYTPQRTAEHLPGSGSRVGDKKNTLIKGAAFRHKTKWAPNRNGPRSVDDALSLAEEYDVYITDDVRINFIDDALYERRFGEFGDSYASYGHVRTQSLDQQLTFDSALADKDGNVNVYVRKSVLESDEAIVAVLHHETHEVESLRDVFSRDVSKSAREYRDLICDSKPGNLHWEAVDIGDEAVRQLRRDRGV